MLNEQLLYLTTVLFLVGPVSISLCRRSLSLSRMVFFLFALDTVITIEAAFYADIILIALLHVITIPAFIVLIYADVVNQSNIEFKCFICERSILSEDKKRAFAIRIGNQSPAL